METLPFTPPPPHSMYPLPPSLFLSVSFNQGFIQRAMETLPLTPEGTLDTASAVVVTPEALEAAKDVVGRVSV